MKTKGSHTVSLGNSGSAVTVAVFIKENKNKCKYWHTITANGRGWPIYANGTKQKQLEKVVCQNGRL